MPYWYLERTNIGHLALAVYQMSGIPIQEFSCRKGKGAENSSGRADLYVSIPNGNGAPVRLNIEAKQAWCSINFNNRSKLVLRSKLDEAIKDCRKIKDKAWKARLGAGLLFLAPYAKNMPKKKAIAVQQRAFSNAVLNESLAVGADFAAFHYPEKRLLWNISRKYSEFDWCPGIAVIGKLIS